MVVSKNDLADMFVGNRAQLKQPTGIKMLVKGKIPTHTVLSLDYIDKHAIKLYSNDNDYYILLKAKNSMKLIDAINSQQK